MIALSCMTLGLSFPAFARDSAGFGRCDVKKLNLTEQQKKQLRENSAIKRRTPKEQMRRELLKYQQQVDTLVQQTNFDEKRAQTIVNEKISHDAGFEMNRLKMRHAFFHILTPQQKAVWQKECSFLDSVPTD